jgi:hypothetical protein
MIMHFSVVPMHHLFTCRYFHLTLIHIYSWRSWLLKILIYFIVQAMIRTTKHHIESLHEDIHDDISYCLFRCLVHCNFDINQIIEIFLKDFYYILCEKLRVPSQLLSQRDVAGITRLLSCQPFDKRLLGKAGVRFIVLLRISVALFRRRSNLRSWSLLIALVFLFTSCF